MGKVDANFRIRLIMTPGIAWKDKLDCSGWVRRCRPKGKGVCVVGVGWVTAGRHIPGFVGSEAYSLGPSLRKRIYIYGTSLRRVLCKLSFTSFKISSLWLGPWRPRGE